MGRLTDKYTLITGGTSGIGLATAQAFIAEGARVAVTGRNPDTLAEAERILGDKAWVIPTDAGDISSHKALAETLAALWPRLDAVFLNAGDVTHAPLEEWREETWDRLMPLTKLGQALGELNVEIDVLEDVDVLGIPRGKINVQRLFYWHVCKAFYRPDLTLEEMNHINFDWFTPKYSHRQTPEEVRTWCEEVGLVIETMKKEEAGITVVARRPAG